MIFMDAIVDDIASQSSVDSSRLYAIGFSQGGDYHRHLGESPNRPVLLMLVIMSRRDS